MKQYIAKVNNHQSIIYLANDDKDAIKWANDLKRELYGENSELTSIWNHDEKRQIEVETCSK